MTKSILEGEFWFSELQLCAMISMGGIATINFCELEDDAQIVPYTEMMSSKEDRSNFPDAKYLGSGYYHHVDFLKNHKYLTENSSNI